MSRKKLIVLQVASGAKLGPNRKACLKGLGLDRLWVARELEDTPSVRGMINRVPDLVRIVDDNFLASDANQRAWRTRVRLITQETNNSRRRHSAKMAGVVPVTPATNPFKPIGKPTGDEEKK